MCCIFSSWLAGWTGLPFPFWLRLPSILADAANVWIVYKLVGERVLAGERSERSAFWSLILLAGAPTLILISGFHGNTDSPVVMFFLLLSVYWIRKRPQQVGRGERSFWPGALRESWSSDRCAGDPFVFIFRKQRAKALAEPFRVLRGGRRRC